jgi:hypothetical protein
MRRIPLNSLMFVMLALCATAGVAGMGLLLAIAKPTHAGSPDSSVVPLGGLQYEAMLGRPIDVKDSVDRQIVGRLPAEERRTKPGEMLFGAFVAVSNDSPRPLRAASRIELEDNYNRFYRALRLPPGNPYAYTPRSIPPHTRLPGADNPVAQNLAATGYLLLFRVPTSVFQTGVLELVIHDPGHPDRTVSVVV